jgi:O-acetylserine/cysteine efflux transporter
MAAESNLSLLLEYGQLASLVTADERGWLALTYTILIGGIVGFGPWFWLIARCSMAASHPSVCCFRCSP